MLPASSSAKITHKQRRAFAIYDLMRCVLWVECCGLSVEKSEAGVATPHPSSDRYAAHCVRGIFGVAGGLSCDARCCTACDDEGVVATPASRFAFAIVEAS